MDEAREPPTRLSCTEGKKKKRKRQQSEGRRQRHGWIVVGLRMSIFEAHTRCFSVSLGLETPPLYFPCPYRTI